MKTITLTTAVLAAVKAFRGDIFSIFNITRSIREDVESGTYELTGSGRTVYHDDVKAIFEELMDNVYGSQYQTRDSGRGYREFQLIVQGQTAQCPAPGCTNPVTTSCATPSCPQAVQPLDAVRDNITQYLRDNGPRTMKQIQSRLKGFSTTCEDLATYLSKLGLVDSTTKANAPSKIKSV